MIMSDGPSPVDRLWLFIRWILGDAHVPALDRAARVVLVLLVLWGASQVVRMELDRWRVRRAARPRRRPEGGRGEPGA